MKNLKIIILLLILISSFFISQYLKENINDISKITSKTILDARATLIALGLAVNVDIGAPKIYIDSPLNQTYTTTSLELNFTIIESNLDKTYYNLDNGANTTITGNTSFTTTVGSHTLKLFANDTVGNLNSSSVTFVVTRTDAGGEAAGGGGGGGGGGGKKIIQEAVTNLDQFSVNKDLIKVSLLQGEIKRESLEIENTGTTALDLNIDLENLKDFLFFPGGLSKYELRLKPGEKQELQLIFNAAKDYKPGVYSGKIIIISPTVKKIIATVVEIESTKKIFDVDVKLDDKQVIKGRNVVAEITLFNLGHGAERVDTQVEYGIKDFKNNIIAKQEKRVAVETQSSFTANILVPEYLENGRYVFYTIVTFDDQVGTATAIFEVISSPKGFLRLSTLLTYIIPGFILIIIILILIEHFILHKKKENFAEKNKIAKELYDSRIIGKREYHKIRGKIKRNIKISTILIILIGILIFFNYNTITGNLLKSEGQKLIVTLDIPSDQEKINPGQSLLLEVAIREPDGTMEEKSILYLEYSIKDSQGNIISEKKESGVIAVKQSKITSLLIPTNIKPGVYTAYVNVNYKENNYIESKTFEVMGNKKIDNIYQLSFITTLLILIIFVIIFFFGRKRYKNLDNKDLIKIKKHKKKRKRRG